MGIRLISEVLNHAPDELTWRERYALVVLAENANDHTRECWPGIEDDREFAQRIRVRGRSSRYEVLAGLRDKGALEAVASGRRGRRAVYRIPAMRPETPDAIGSSKHPETPDALSEQGPETPDAASGNHGPNRGAERPDFPDPANVTASGNAGQRVRKPRPQRPESTDPFPSYPSDQPEREQASQPAEPDAVACDIPAEARPLVDAITAAGVFVRWPFHGNGWFPVLSMIKKSGVPAMVDHALKAAARADIESAKYFLQGWRELPPLPSVDVKRPQLRAVKAAGHQPFQPPTDLSVYANGF
ncbi:hypothetical protein PV392_29575 [Streptomyces sp. ME03-5709C]|nr:hypothetical protein [Streptomyces sp. ME03-5709C]